jgi:HD-like signal output (HDOD) protein
MIQGEIQTFPHTDLLQWIALTRRTGQLAITQGDQELKFFFAAGEIAAASSSEIIGPDSPENARAVLASSLAWSWGYFVFKEGQLPAEVSASNLHLPVEGLLLEVSSKLDEDRKADAELDYGDHAEGTQADGYSETFTLADDLRLQIVDRLLREDFRVPPVPQLAARVLELTRDGDFSLRALENLILSDQAVTAQVLRYANSALRGGGRQVDTLRVAMQRLGSDEVVHIALAASVQFHHQGRDIFAEQKRYLWTHSSVTAFFARSLAGQAGLDRNLGFLCGLLMDFGMSVLYSLIQDVLSHGNAPSKTVAGIVQDYHPRIGRVVGEKWLLPQAVIESMAYHHCVEEAPTNSPYVSVAALADFLATFALSQPRATLEESLSGFPPERLSHHPAGRLIKLGPGKAAAVLRDLPRQLDQALQFIAT